MGTLGVVRKREKDDSGFTNVDEIAIDPYKGEQKTGDLSGIWSSGF
ncbi:type II toxin-antitoxin system RelE/ParE family toxin, partial [Enterococcus faecium]|nr:type II toxin-antitoxin system RelE/ParE family toxin [Enterococcus faecium]MCH3537812.1 type II toxin-antitoxin system RelE/ParE family toxin [Enterococcus faecium]